MVLPPPPDGPKDRTQVKRQDVIGLCCLFVWQATFVSPLASRLRGFFLRGSFFDFLTLAS